MNRRDLQLPSGGGIVHVGQELYEVSFGSLSPAAIVAELLLLSEGYVQELSLWHQNQETKVRLSIVDTSMRAVATTSSTAIQIGLSRRELESWIAFFLRYHASNAAEVDHFDLEARNEAGATHVVDIVFKVGEFSPPVSSEEARRKLRLR